MAKNVSSLIEELGLIGAIGDVDLQESLAPEVYEEGEGIDLDDLLEACNQLTEGFKILRELATQLEEASVNVTANVQALNEAIGEEDDD